MLLIGRVCEYRSRALAQLAAVVLALCLVIPGMAAGTAATGATKAGGTSDASVPPDLADAGLISQDSYRSPHFDYTVDWSGILHLATKEEYAIDQPVETGDNPAEDLIVLAWTGEGTCTGIVAVNGIESGFASARKQVAAWMTDDYIANSFAPYVNVSVLAHKARGDTGEVLYSLVDTSKNNRQNYTLLQDIELRSGDHVDVEFSTHGRCLEAAFTDVTASVRFNGEPILGLLDWERIEHEIGD